MAKKSRSKRQITSKDNKPSQTLAIVSLILNIIIIPGLGTILSRKYKIGFTQLIIALISLPLMYVVIGFPIFVAVWIWALVTSIKFLQQAS